MSKLKISEKNRTWISTIVIATFMITAGWNGTDALAGTKGCGASCNTSDECGPGLACYFGNGICCSTDYSVRHECGDGCGCTDC